MDNLTAICELQKELNKSVASELLNNPNQGEVISRLAYAVIREAIETQDEAANWKWWKKGKHVVNNAKLDEEIIDQLFFVVAQLIVRGYDTGEKIHQLYINKWRKNMNRPDFNHAKNGDI